MNDTRDVELNAIGVLQIVRETIVGIARDQGRQLVQTSQGEGSRDSTSTRPNWIKEDALEIDVLAQSEDEFRFNVTWCRYPEM